MRPATQVHRVREFNAMRRECKCGGHRRFILHLHVPEAKQLSEGFADSALLKSVQAAQNPTGFEQYCFGDPDLLGCEQASCRGGLLAIVTRQQPNQYVSIDRDHDAA